MSRWIDPGYKWNTGTTYTVRELLKENRIPFRMPSDEMFFQSMYHLPHRDRIWGIRIKRKDSARVLSLLEQEGLLLSPAPPRERQEKTGNVMNSTAVALIRRLKYG